MVKHNRRYKDSVFVDLFGEDKSAKDNFLALYNALHGTHLDSSTEFKRLRLEQVMYMTFYNDVAHLVDDRIIVLVEHQSTINRNMPLRCLQYVARLYEQIQDPKAKYYRTLQKIPTPEVYVFYNGTEDYPERTTLKLSDAFMTMPSKPSLEVVVSVININYNHHTPTQSIVVWCSHKVVAVGFYTSYYGAVRRGIKPSARIKAVNYYAPVSRFQSTRCSLTPCADTRSSTVKTVLKTRLQSAYKTIYCGSTYSGNQGR